MNDPVNNPGNNPVNNPGNNKAPLSAVSEPALLLDEARCRRNLQRMLERAHQAGVRLRPHCKTHQSRVVGRWLRDAGVDRITVSSIAMAEYFADDGWTDILVAFPLNPGALPRYEALAQRCRLAVLLDSSEGLASLAHRPSGPLGYYVDIDAGYGRTGIPFEEVARIDALIDTARRVPQLEFCGFYCHPGDTYQHRDASAREAILASALAGLTFLKQRFTADNPAVLVGDTPSCSGTAAFPGVDEITPGNFLFYDLFQATLGVCAEEEIAVAMACPVVGRYPERGEVVIHGGSVHFSRDALTVNGRPLYGKTALATHGGWIPDPAPVMLHSLSQEHGILHMAPERLAQTAIGDVLYLLPVHSCLTADAMGAYRDLEGRGIDHLRGASAP